MNRISKIIIALLVFALVISIRFNYINKRNDERLSNFLVERYTASVTYTENLERIIKGNSPSASQYEFIGNAFAFGEAIKNHDFPQLSYEETSIYHDVPYDMRTLYSWAIYSDEAKDIDERSRRLKKVLKVYEIASNHLTPEAIADPIEFEKACRALHSKVWEQKILPDELMFRLEW